MVPIKQFTFPCGEPHIQILEPVPKGIDYEWDFVAATSIVELMLLGDAIRRMGASIGTLTIPYVPFGRQDRVASPGEPLSIAVMADVINKVGAQKVVITDPHSDVTPALIHNCEVIPQWEVFRGYFPIIGNTLLVSPDGGALKKIYELAKIVELDVLECSKRRDVRTGVITGVHVPVQHLQRATCVIVDDICDGGRTFVELAKSLRKANAGRIILMVTHGFFTKGLGVFDGLIDEIYTRKGRAK